MFASKLADAVRSTQGGRSAILMGFDGIPVEQYAGEGGKDIETVGMELSVVLKEVRKAVELLEAGKTEEVTVRTEELVAVVRIVNDDYFVILTLDPTGNVGKARYLLRLLAPDIRGELA